MWQGKSMRKYHSFLLYNTKWQNDNTGHLKYGAILQEDSQRVSSLVSPHTHQTVIWDVWMWKESSAAEEKTELRFELIQGWWWELSPINELEDYSRINNMPLTMSRMWLQISQHINERKNMWPFLKKTAVNKHQHQHSPIILVSIERLKGAAIIELLLR